MTVVTFQVSASTDDAGSRAQIYDAVGVRLTLGNPATLDPQTQGLRFTNVTVPNGAVITSATLQVCFDSGEGGPVTTRWYGHDVDNSATFAATNDTLTGVPRRRSPLTASSDVGTLNWSGTTAGTFINAASVTQAISAVVGRPGWASGNALVLIGVNAGTPVGNRMDYRTYDHSSSPATGAKLVIDYFVPAKPTAPKTNWSALGKEDNKAYVYRVYSAAGAFIGTWSDVTDTPRFTQALNTPGTTTTVQLARSPNNKIEQRGYLLSQAGDRMVSEALEPIIVSHETPNNVGTGTDVDLNYKVDIYVIYGQYDRLISQTGDYITSQTGDYIITTSGAPMGKRIFSGFIMDYQTEYGDKNGVTVTLASHGYELSHQLVLYINNTTVNYTNTELGMIAKFILDTNPGMITYDAASIADTATSRTLKFVVNTKKEAIESIFEQTPAGWYWFVDVAENLLVLKQRSSTADHTFVAGRDIKSLSVKQTIEALVNDVYFIGGEVTPGTPSTTLFKHYTEPTSLATYPRRGLKRITDRRYTIVANAQARADKDFSRFKNPVFTSPLVISASRYDIETIKLGQTVQFRGFGNFLDALAPLQIVRLGYSPTEVTLELGELQDKHIDLLADVQEGLENEQFTDLPIAPS